MPFWRLFIIVPISIGSLLLCGHVYRKWKLRKRKISGLKIKVINNSLDWIAVESAFLSAAKQEMVVGFDCEWTTTSGRTNPVAVLQLATWNKICVLIRTSKFECPFPEGLRNLLSDHTILKVGVGSHLDAAKLCKDYGLTVNGYLDICWIAMRYSHQEIQRFGLKSLALQVLGVDINKSLDIRCSNWDNDHLTSQQEAYAAEDAFVALQIFLSLVKPHLTFWHWAEHQNGVPWVIHIPEIGQCINRPFRLKHRVTNTIKNSSPQRINVQSSKKSIKRAFAARSTPLYHNCILEAPDGQQLCTCDIRKIQWYLEKNLGDLVSNEPVVVRLKFEPSGRPQCDEDFYLQAKENCCVVCGSTDSYIRKNVVPHEYRKHFPTIMKNHKSHDIVLLCLECHQLSNFHDMNLKLQLAETYAAPIGTTENHRVFENSSLKKVRSVARALKQPSLPSARRQQLEQFLCTFYNVEVLDNILIENAMNLDIMTENKDYLPHGLKVVMAVVESEGILALERMWRQHFLDTMRPKYLPDLWSVNHRHDILIQNSKDTHSLELLVGKKSKQYN